MPTSSVQKAFKVFIPIIISIIPSRVSIVLLRKSAAKELKRLVQQELILDLGCRNCPVIASMKGDFNELGYAPQRSFTPITYGPYSVKILMHGRGPNYFSG